MDEAGFSSADNSLERWQTDQVLARAIEDCAAAVGVDPPDPTSLVQNVNGAVTSVVECLRSEDWDVDQPTESPGGLLSLETVDRHVTDAERPSFDADFEVCLEAAHEDAE